MPGNKIFSHTPVKVEMVDTTFRKIKTEIPVPESIPMLNQMYELESRSMHGQMPIIWDKAKDYQVYDCWGNMWLDFTSTIFVANSGHGNKRITDSLIEAINKPLLHTYTYANNERINYLKYLIENTPEEFEKAFLLSSGTEATEVVLKLMRLKGRKINKRKPGIICFDGSYHGRTVGAQLMTGNDKAKEWIGFEDPNIYHLPFPFPWSIESKNSEKFFYDSMNVLLKKNNLDPKKDICGFLLETFQGWGAMFFQDNFVKAIEKYAKDNEILLAFDEIQSGFGRTGELFGYMHYNVKPDLIACGKGASSGIPLSIVMGSSELMDLPDVGSMSSTNSANPISSISGYNNLKEILDRDLIGNSKNLGSVMHRKLNYMKDKYSDHLKYVCGKGLIAAAIFYDKNNKPMVELCDTICEKALQKGLLLVHTGRESIKIGPPLTISEEALLEGLNVLDECIGESIMNGTK